MLATDLCNLLYSAGMELDTDGQKLTVVHADRLDDGMRTAIRQHKSELIAYLQESSRITARLLDAAMRRCDQFKDSDKARQDMRQQVLEIPPHQRQEWLDYFNETNQEAKP